MTNLYIGMMSGTSADGIDAVLVDFSHDQPNILASSFTPYHAAIKNKILNLYQPGDNEIIRMGEMDTLLGKAFANAANGLLQQQHIEANQINAIGCHGQTIRHIPDEPYRFTLQIGNPNIIAKETGITTIADFRRKDLALGGQGAPLVPAFHRYAFASKEHDRVIVNIGGIANITMLLKNGSDNMLGYDTGPGNVLMDEWIHQHQEKAHDENGDWAATGRVQETLLQKMLKDPYFQLAPPKSTGREYFNMDWLTQYVANERHEDIQATLAELTATSILNAIHHHTTSADVVVCGGGARNAHLMQRLTELGKPKFTITTTEQFGIHPDWVEAVAFAWLAKQTSEKQPGNVPSVTGAEKEAVLGGIYSAS